MTQLFDNYTSDIQKSFSLVKTSLQSSKQIPLGKKQSTLPKLKVEMFEIQKLIKLMQTQVVSFTGKLKNSSSQKIKSYKVQYETIRKKVVAFDQQIRQQRNKQKQSNTPTTTSHSLQLNQRSSSTKSKYSKLQQQRSDEQDVNLKLKESVKMMYEIGDMSDNISHELSNQTGKLQESTSKLGIIRGQLIKGQKKIKKMMIRLRKNQFVFYLVILMIVLMAAFIVSRIF